MKILLLGRTGLFDNLGGDLIQIQQTVENLNALGIETKIETTEYKDMEKFDLVHVFQLDWNLECFFQIKKAKQLKKPVVFSPIHHSLKEVKRFDDEYVFDFRRISKFLFTDQFKRDLFKELYRSVFKPARLAKVLFCYAYGPKNFYRYALKHSDIVLVQTEKEAKDLKETFNVDFKWQVVRNGVGKFFMQNHHNDQVNKLSFSDYILCVGRIEPRKNQLKIIEAVKLLRQDLNTDLRLVLIGGRSANKHFEYFHLLDQNLADYKWITHISKVDYAQMPTYYRFAKVCVSASWFETTGLTSLEAIFSGTNAVAAGERASEYLKDLASYCDPGDVESIKNAIKIEFLARRPHPTQEMLENFTWENAAKETLKVYNLLLK